MLKRIIFTIVLMAILLPLFLMAGCQSAPPGVPVKVIATETWFYQAYGGGYFVMNKYENYTLGVTGGCFTDTNNGTRICSIVSGSATLSNNYFYIHLHGMTLNQSPNFPFEQELDNALATNGYAQGGAYMTGFNTTPFELYFGVPWAAQRLSGSNITTNL